MMDAKTLEALKASIAKWERNAEATDTYDFRIGEYDCPLCELFLHPDHCECCPVFEKTSERFCRGTPYINASSALTWWVLGGARACDRARAAARDEVAFLKSLLPEETP